MKLAYKNVIDGDLVNYQWIMEEVKTAKACLKMALSACKIGELSGVECRGYQDMDEHENVCTFATQKEFAEGLDKVKKIEADRIELTLKVDGEEVNVTFGPCSDRDAGNWVKVYGREDIVKKVSAELKNMVGGIH